MPNHLSGMDATRITQPTSFAMLSNEPLSHHLSSATAAMPATPTTPSTAAAVATSRLPTGVYVPMLAFFTASDAIDVPATQRHTARLLAAGVAGLVVHGSNGEAAHLSRAERTVAIRAVADAVRHAADPPSRVPIIAGCGAQSVRETVEMCAEARESGATHVLVLPPGYYAGLLGTEGLVTFFTEVADQSPLPVLVYNYPGAAHGVDLDSDVLLRIAKHPNVVGVKLTCGNTGKLARLAAETPKVRDGRNDFFVAGGSADFLLQGMAVGGHGTIAGFANLAPRACVRIIDLFERGEFAEARHLQAEVAKADWLAIRYGFVGVKAAMAMFHGEEETACCAPRSPLKRLPRGGKAEEEIRAGMAAVMAIEAELASGKGDR